MMAIIRQISEPEFESDKKDEVRLEKAFQKLRVVVIGAAGKKGGEYLNALMKREDIEISAVLINKRTSPIIDELKKQGTKVIQNGSIDVLITTIAFEIAVISVPHSEHDLITQALLRAGKFVIKEKPLAMTMVQANRYHFLIEEKESPPIFTTVQRDTLPSFVNAREDLSLIGKPIKFDYEYCFNLPTVTTGWRAKNETAGGGVILDMGYHAIDVITKFFGVPNKISSLVGYKYLETAQEELEDSAEIFMGYGFGLKGRLVLDRHAYDKKEIFKIHGTLGVMSITPQGYQVFNLTGEVIKKVDCQRSKEEEIIAMFRNAIPYHQNLDSINKLFIRNMQNVQIIEAIYSCKQFKLEKRKLSDPNSLVQMGIFSKRFVDKSADIIAEYCNDDSVKPLVTRSFNIN